ncbi:MAG: thiamine phosphate synthase, partial [Rhodospirillales bacterium]|nr:thiamine phosphate synthase [Rhodospirillales bacterium]
MDGRLIGWARAVKRRRHASGPVLWLFTDRRGPDPLEFARTAPRGLCGIVLRDDAAPDRADLARRLARLCRARGLALAIAGDW